MVEETSKEICGIVMPIGATPECSESHWIDVREIIEEAIVAAGFTPNLVSDATDVGIIQKRIIQNLYENPIVVCDVSCKNPNVTFELGMRLAFDKPTIIVKDDVTAYSFDTSPIEHLTYPRDLRFGKIVEFKDILAAKISGTFKKATTDKSYTTFLKHFGEFTVAKLDRKEVSSEQFIVDQLNALGSNMRRLEALMQTSNVSYVSHYIPRLLNGVPPNEIRVELQDGQNAKDVMKIMSQFKPFISAGIEPDGYVVGAFDPNIEPRRLREIMFTLSDRGYSVMKKASAKV